MHCTIRKGKATDMPAVFNLIMELAIFEKEPQEVEISVDQLIEDGFSNNCFEVLVAEMDSEVVGFTLFYEYYSTWKGRCLFLEDFVVGEKHRNKGIGKLLFTALKEETKARSLKRLDWNVLDWNESAIKFYKQINADFKKEWVLCRLDENALNN